MSNLHRAARASISLSVSFGIVAFSALAAAATLEVGPGKTYAAPCAAFAAASDGDTIEIDASGSYVGDVCSIAKSSLTIRGVGGRPKIDAGGTSSGGKAIWVVDGNDTTIENVEMFGCSVTDKNGAAIRMEGTNLTLDGVFFHDNDDGILTGANTSSTIVISNSEFARNGYGDGYSHNMYIGQVKSFTLQNSYSHDVKVGHLVKSRALENHILYNRITEESGTGSYEIDVPQGGNTWIIGNAIEQNAATENPTIVTFAEESTSNPGQSLFVVNNTIVNDLGHGTFVSVSSSIGVAAVVRNNVFTGTGTQCTQSSAILEGNFSGDPGFADRASYDYRLAAGSSAIDAGVAPGTGDGVSLVPMCQYVSVASAVVREVVGTIDVGAFEYGGETTTPCGGTAPGDAGVIDSGPTDTGSTRTDSGTTSTDSGAAHDASGADSSTKDSGSDAGKNDAASTDASAHDGATSGDGATSDAATSDDAGANGDDTSGSCTCSTTGGERSNAGAWAAVLVGLALLGGRRRRRAARAR